MVALLLLAVASVAVAADTVVGMAAKARTEAKRWKADAALVEVIVAVQPDGTPRPGTMFNFLSPATRQGLMVSVADGKTTTMAMPVDTAALPIPERFVDLSQAVAAAKMKGFGPPVQATLKAFPTERGSRAAWMLGGVPTKGPDSGTVWVDAASGAVTSFDELSGHAEARQRKASGGPEAIPVSHPVDFGSLRRKADAVAVTHGTDFKLHRVELQLRSAALRIVKIDFHYSRPTPPRGGPASGWEELIVHVTAPGRRPIKWDVPKRNALAAKEYPGEVSGGETTAFDDPKPNPVPASVLPPEDALRRLNRGPLGNPGSPIPGRASGGLSGKTVTVPVDVVNDWVLSMQLVQAGAAYRMPSDERPSIPVTPKDSGAAFFAETAPKAKWIWWAIAQDPNVGARRFEFLYLDATTGQATSHCAEPHGDRLVEVPCATPRAGKTP